MGDLVYRDKIGECREMDDGSLLVNDFECPQFVVLDTERQLAIWQHLSVKYADLSVPSFNRNLPTDDPEVVCAYPSLTSITFALGFIMSTLEAFDALKDEETILQAKILCEHFDIKNFPQSKKDKVAPSC